MKVVFYTNIFLKKTFFVIFNVRMSINKNNDTQFLKLFYP